MNIASFIPMDRRQALAHGVSLPEHVAGAALFADISGFTPLAAALVAAIGPQRGAEELTALLDGVYTALSSTIDQYRGSVIGFAGDAVTCWFDDVPVGGFQPAAAPPVLRAVTCAAALQQAMRAFADTRIDTITASLGLKVAVSVGTARRFLVGDPAIRRIEVLAGATIEQLGQIERLAARGEIVITPAAAADLGPQIAQGDVRIDNRYTTPAIVLRAVLHPARPEPWPALDPGMIPLGVARMWLLPAIYDRLQRGHSLFLSELRSAVALFVGFGDLAYDTDPAAGAQLDAYVRWVQSVLERYGGSLIDITMSEKGSYLYISFGAPQIHADESDRATAAALELRSLPSSLGWIADIRIGLSSGQVRTGTYGGTTLTYGALGETVNMAARLMQAAAPGQVLANGMLALELSRRYILQPLPSIKVKGRQEPLAIISIVGERGIPSFRMQEARYALPIIGRAEELQQLRVLLTRVLAGEHLVAGIVGEAGLGKSRLIAEIIRQATDMGLRCLLGEAPSYGSTVAYLAWRPILHGFFGINYEMTAEEKSTHLAAILEELGPNLVARMPLLDVALDLPLEENDLTRGLEARVRKEALESLLVDCLQAYARRRPLMLVLEDAHWLDPLSVDLAAALARELSELPVMILLAYRPAESEPGTARLLPALPNLVEIPVPELTSAGVAELTARKLEALFRPGLVAAPELMVRIEALAQGNPFYIEELLNFLKDYGITPDNAEAIAQLELPSSLAQLLLSRIDRLTSDQQTTLKVASIIGRVFPAAWLRGVYPNLGPEERIEADLESLSRLDLTSLYTLEPELHYLFKHVITQEVIYESLPYALRAQLHEQLGHWIEQTLIASPPLDLLAFHYGRSGNRAKQIEYYRLAGRNAAAHYANTAAIRYFSNLLPLLEGDNQAEIELELGQVLAVIGEWDQAQRRYETTLAGLSSERSLLRARIEQALGALLWSRSRFEEALAMLAHAAEIFAEQGDSRGRVRALNEIAALSRIRGDYSRAYEALAESRAAAEAADDQHGLSRVFHVYGTVASMAGDLAAAHDWCVQALELRRRLGYHYEAAATLNNLGLNLVNLGDPRTALPLIEEARQTFRDIGDRRTSSIASMSLARTHIVLGNYAQARELLLDAIEVFDRLHAHWEMATSITRLAHTLWRDGEPLEHLERAVRLCGIAEGVVERIGAVLQPHDRETIQSVLANATHQLGEAVGAALYTQGQQMALREAVGLALAERENA